jgi:glycosyltransferase involved in cell wall biosynthesis
MTAARTPPLSAAKRGLYPAVSVIIPAFDEENGIAGQIKSVRDTLEAKDIEHEILVVDDGSRDATAERALQAGARVLRHAQNRGYGASLKAGILAAHHETIVITDADGTYPSDRIPALLDALETSDMAVGARIGQTVRIPLIRRPAKWVLGWVANRIAGRRIPDLNSGLRAFRRDTAEQYFTILSNKFSFTTTITLSFIADDYEVTYVPIDYYARIGRSKITPRHFMDFMVLVFRVAMLFQPLRVFLPLSLGFGALGVIKIVSDIVAFFFLRGGTGIEALQRPVLSTSALLLLMVSLQLAVLGLVADGVLRRIAQQGRALLPSRAPRLAELTPSEEVVRPHAFTG